MTSAPAAKRKLDDSTVKAEPGDDDVQLVHVQQEPFTSGRNHLVKLLVGDYVQYSSQRAVQELLPDPAYFQSGPNTDGSEYRVRLQAPVDAFAAHVVLLAALSPQVPVDGNCTANGLTLDKLRQAATFFKIDAEQIGIKKPVVVVPQQHVSATAPQASVAKNNALSVVDIQKDFDKKPQDAAFLDLTLVDIVKLVRENFLAVSSELEVYQAVMNWCHHKYPSRWTKEIFDSLLVEIRWDLFPGSMQLAIVTAAGPLRETLSDLQKTLFLPKRLTVSPRERHFTECVYLFYADRNYASLRVYDWRPNKLKSLPLPQEVKPWTPYKEMGPLVNEKLWLRVQHGQQVKTYAYSLSTQTADYIFEEKFISEDGYPITCIDGKVYGWDFRNATGKQNKSFKYNTGSSTFLHGVDSPKVLRTEAASDCWNGKFYYCGGTPMRGKNRDPLSSVEVCDTRNENWTTLPDTLQARRCFATKVCNGYLYVSCGAYSSRPGILSSCERLNLNTAKPKWERIAFLTAARYQHCMFVVNNQLYVCGGYTADGQADWMEVYDPQRNCWNRVLLHEGRFGPVAACVTVMTRCT